MYYFQPTILPLFSYYTAQKMKCSIKDFFSKCEKISRKLENRLGKVQCYDVDIIGARQNGYNFQLFVLYSAFTRVVLLIFSN